MTPQLFDEEIFQRFRTDSTPAGRRQIGRQLQALANILANRYYRRDPDEGQSIAMIGLCRGLQSYTAEHGTGFGFLWQCGRNAILDHQRKPSNREASAVPRMIQARKSPAEKAAEEIKESGAYRRSPNLGTGLCEYILGGGTTKQGFILWLKARGQPRQGIRRFFEELAEEHRPGGR